MPTGHTEEPLVRILLHRVDEAIELPQPGRAYRATWSGGAVWLWGPLTMSATASESVWQVAALSDADAAAQLADRLSASIGGKVEVRRSTTEEGLVRVRVAWPADRTVDGGAELAAIGYPDAFPVPGRGRVRIEGRGGPLEADTEIVLEPEGAWPTAVGRRRYLGRFRVRVSGFELLVINQLNMESYLRGVLPAEMGPAAFPELEALKAQAVAARTYAVAHLADHEDEGYDLCASPACQVYRGSDVHHDLSDRAVEETSGLIAVYEGRPIDAMYTSTCGGHTEDAELLFPDRAQPYLKGVACEWDRPLILEGSGGGTTLEGRSAFNQHMAVEALGLPSGLRSLQAIVNRVAELCGGPPTPLGPTPGLAAYADALLTAAALEDPEVLAERSGAGRIVDMAELFGVDLDLPDRQSWRDGWQLRAAAAVLELQGVLVRDRGEAVPHPEGIAIYPRRAVESEPLPDQVPLYWRWGDSYGSATAVKIMPGTTLERVRLFDELLAVVVVQSGGGAEADRRSAWRSWVRERSWRELADGVGLTDLAELRITRRSPSGRVIGLVADGKSGDSVQLEGFPIRLALGVPENLFTFSIVTRPDGSRVARFLGRGWGHGVGMCQNGSYGLARAGKDFAGILGTYYTGIGLQRWDEPTTVFKLPQ
jgi:stage II sporulation protein D